jgi:hypothetical protein
MGVGAHPARGELSRFDNSQNVKMNCWIKPARRTCVRLKDEERVCARKTGRVEVATSRIGAIQYCSPFNTFKPFNRCAPFKTLTALGQLGRNWRYFTGFAGKNTTTVGRRPSCPWLDKSVVVIRET